MDVYDKIADLAGKTTANSIGSTYMEMAEAYGAACSGVDTRTRPSRWCSRAGQTPP